MEQEDDFVSQVLHREEESRGGVLAGTKTRESFMQSDAAIFVKGIAESNNLVICKGDHSVQEAGLFAAGFLGHPAFISRDDEAIGHDVWDEPHAVAHGK
jgi:hypothetical protein